MQRLCACGLLACAFLAVRSCGAPLTVVKSINDIYSNVALQAAEVGPTAMLLHMCLQLQQGVWHQLFRGDSSCARLVVSMHEDRPCVPLGQQRRSLASRLCWAAGYCQGYPATNRLQGPESPRSPDGYAAVLHRQTASYSSRSRWTAV